MEAVEVEPTASMTMPTAIMSTVGTRVASIRMTWARRSITAVGRKRTVTIVPCQDADADAPGEPGEGAGGSGRRLGVADGRRRRVRALGPDVALVAIPDVVGHAVDVPDDPD